MGEEFEYIDLMVERAKRCVSIKEQLDSVESKIDRLKYQIELLEIEKHELAYDHRQSQMRLERLCDAMQEGGMSQKEVSQKMRDAFIRAKRGY